MTAASDFPWLDEIIALRHRMHSNPELGMQEHQTADLVASQLEAWGIETHRGIGGTGVVAVIRGGNAGGTVGLRADMDALPIQETDATLPYRSRNAGVMHACGHDGHTAILLGTARHLAATRRFNGTAHLIFQPGEEGAGGALAMLEDGLFERFPCDAIYALHNNPMGAIGEVAVNRARSNAGGSFFDITIHGKGSHAAAPHLGIDTVLIAGQIITALQAIVARNVAPSESAVISVTRVQAGDAYNVIPEVARLSGTIRAFTRELLEELAQRLEKLTRSIAEGHGATCDVDCRLIFAPLNNTPEEAVFVADTAARILGPDKAQLSDRPAAGSEDFSFMLERVPGAYFMIGNGLGGAMLHNAAYNFNDDGIAPAIRMFTGLVEGRLRQELA